MKKIIVLLFGVLLLTGCEKPYNMLSDQDKVVRTFTEYVEALSNKEYEKAYSFLSFVHVPQGGNKEAFLTAQKLMDSMFSSIEYEVTKMHKAENVAVIDVSMIYTHRAGGEKTRTDTQVFLHKQGDKWLIVTGIYEMRMQLLRIYPSMKDTFQLKPDVGYIQKDGKWVKVEPQGK